MAEILVKNFLQKINNKSTVDDEIQPLAERRMAHIHWEAKGKNTSKRTKSVSFNLSPIRKENTNVKSDCIIPRQSTNPTQQVMSPGINQHPIMPSKSTKGVKRKAGAATPVITTVATHEFSSSESDESSDAEIIISKKLVQVRAKIAKVEAKLDELVGKQAALLAEAAISKEKKDRKEKKNRSKKDKNTRGNNQEEKTSENHKSDDKVTRYTSKPEPRKPPIKSQNNKNVNGDSYLIYLPPASTVSSDNEEHLATSMTNGDKRQLSVEINKLSALQISPVFFIVKKEGCWVDAFDPYNAEIDYDALTPAALRKLEKYVKTCSKNSSDLYCNIASPAEVEFTKQKYEDIVEWIEDVNVALGLTNNPMKDATGGDGADILSDSLSDSSDSSDTTSTSSS